MVQIKGIIVAVIMVVIAVNLVPTVWDAVWTDAATSGVNGTSWTLLKLVPMIYVGLVIIGGIMIGIYSARH